MNQRTAKLLHDALSAGREIEQYAASTTRDQFLKDRSLHLIFERLFEIVGEALSQAIKEEPTIRNQIPDVMKIIGAQSHCTRVCRCKLSIALIYGDAQNSRSVRNIGAVTR